MKCLAAFPRCGGGNQVYRCIKVQYNHVTSQERKSILSISFMILSVSLSATIIF